MASSAESPDVKHRSALTGPLRRTHSWAARLTSTFGRRHPGHGEIIGRPADKVPRSAEDDLLRRLREAGL